jgi:hypothetical protein
MKLLNYVGYAGLLFIYFIVVFCIVLFSFDAPDHTHIGPIGIILSLSAIASPFVVVKYVVDQFYPGDNHKRHAHLLIITIAVIWLFHALGTQVGKGLDISYLPMYVFDACLIWSLFIYQRSKVTIREHSAAINKPRFKIKLPQLNFTFIRPTNKAYLISGICAFILIITNPSISAFKAHQGASSYSGLVRKYNFFIFSVYECGSEVDAWGKSNNNAIYNGEYVAVLGNFFRI